MFMQLQKHFSVQVQMRKVWSKSTIFDFIDFFPTLESILITQLDIINLNDKLDIININ